MRSDMVGVAVSSSCLVMEEGAQRIYSRQRRLITTGSSTNLPLLDADRVFLHPRAD
jgi:hypothetical protein